MQLVLKASGYAYSTTVISSYPAALHSGVGGGVGRGGGGRRKKKRHVCKIVKCDYEFHHVCLSVWNNSAPPGKILIKLDTQVFFFENMSRKFKFH
jgi:hypothetical protein